MDVTGRKVMPTVRLRRLASELRNARLAAGLKIEEVVRQTGLDQSSIYRIERALNKPQRRTVMTLLDLYGVTGEKRESFLGWLKDSNQQGWFRAYEPYLPEQYQSYIAFEYEAESSRTYESMFIPGLLQTEDYARALVRGVLPTIDSDAVERRVEARMRRQSVLSRPTPMQLKALVDEAAIRRVVGGPEIMRAQIRHLARVMEQPNIHLQVVPFEAGAHPGMPGSFILLDFADPSDVPLIYTDSMAGDAFLETPGEYKHFEELFDQVAVKALSLADTKKFIKEAA
ncbi:helix-turn-helix domain-containing protein [Actinoplanes sp. HUAS TT8]|uniref:helix-turn-helix domain-containing protein n=1 Tax=Actinoplanes sp. HUAS TT8 TaxID=3447453 RepID=UPI003F51F770